MFPLAVSGNHSFSTPKSRVEWFSRKNIILEFFLRVEWSRVVAIFLPKKSGVEWSGRDFFAIKEWRGGEWSQFFYPKRVEWRGVVGKSPNTGQIRAMSRFRNYAQNLFKEFKLTNSNTFLEVLDISKLKDERIFFHSQK